VKKLGRRIRVLVNRRSNRLRLRDQTPVRLPPEASFLNVLCYVRSRLVDLENCETLYHKTLKNVSDGQRAVASPSVRWTAIFPTSFIPEPVWAKNSVKIFR